MKKSLLVMLGAVALVGSLFVSTETLAQTCNTRNNTAYGHQQNYGYQNNNNYYRQQNHQQRINEGVRTGQLTPAEAYRLRQQEALIRRQELLAKRDGYITYQERLRINRELAQLDREIKQQKHDSQTSYNTRTYVVRSYSPR